MFGNRDIPVYLFTGFLESGKSTCFQEILEEGNFEDGLRTLYLMTEEGEKEEVEMAEIRNKTVKEAREILKELGLELEINNLTEEINENETYVKEQIPKPGIKITKETKVYIDI